MDRNEQNLKMEELKAAMHNKDYQKAVEIADALDLKKIKDNNFLSLVADAYEVSKMYEKAKKVLLIAYENTNAGRHLAYRLCLLAVKTQEFDEAMEFYEDFIEMAPRDTSRYILKYKMAKAKNAPIEKLIKILEEYVNIDMEEKWAYELAKLYHLAGNTEKCIDMCDEISLWFSEGKYVAKAMQLKSIYKPLTASQERIKEAEQKKTEQMEQAAEKQEQTEEFLEEEIADFSDVEVKPADDEKFNTMDIQAVIADGMKEVELDDETNIHEGVQATKVAPDFRKPENEESEKTETVHPGEVQEITGKFNLNEVYETEDMADSNEAQQTEDMADSTEAQQIDETVEELDETPKTDDAGVATEAEPIKDIQDVEDILRQLQARGILKAETVRQAVNIIDEAGKSDSEEKSAVSTMERWEEDSEEPLETEESNSVEKNTNIEETEKEATDLSEKVTEKDSKEDEPSDDIGNTKNIDIPETIAHTAEIKLESQPVTNGGVPVLDLGFDTPVRDTSNDVGQEGIYENTVVNSDLGSTTDSLPSKEEIEEAIRKAEENIAEDVAEPLKSEEGNTELHSDKELSVDVEILSGTDWKQEEVSKKTAEPADADRKDAEKTDIDQKTAEENTEKIADSVTEENQRQSVTPVIAPSVPNPKENEEPKALPVLTEEELSTFKNYLNVEGFATNIKEVLQELIANYTPNGKSTDGNVIIMGNEKTGKTTLAIETIKLVNRKRGRRNRKLAKVDAAALNRRGFRNSLNKLLGSDLIIENAHNLGAMTLSEVIDASGMYTDDMLIVLEGETEPMEKMLSESPRLSETFNHVIRIREYDIKEWVEYGKRYAQEQGYKMDELANLAFYKAIDDFFGSNKGIGQKDVETIVDDAINRSGRIGRKLSGIFSSKKDEDGFYVLVESDFNVK